MNMSYSPLSSGSILNEQVARQIFQILPDEGPMMVIRDRAGNCWPSDSERFSTLSLDESEINNLCARIDDGHEPLVTQTEQNSIVVAQLTTENTDCGYIIMALPNNSPETTLANGDLIEIVLNQVNLILSLVEKNSILLERQARHAGIPAQGMIVSYS